MINIKDFIEFEHQAWQQRGFDYSDYFEILTPQTLPAILDQIEKETSKTVLDLASGPGYIAAGIAKEGYDVTGVDFSSTMVKVASKRYPNIKFVEGDAEKLNFSDQTFDYIIINFGVLHFANPKKCFRECCRILKEGGKLFFTVWLPVEQSLAMKIIYTAINDYADTSVIPEGPDFFKYVDQELATTELKAVGFKDVFSTEVETCWNLENPEIFYNAYAKGGARLGSLIDLQSDQVKDKIRSSIISQVESCKTDNRYIVPVPSILWTAIK